MAQADDGRRRAAFDDRYGEGAVARLLGLLERPCVSFAEIAQQFGVTRERVRQWHRWLLPDAPTGRDRRKACLVYQQRRRLFEDPVFRAFFRHARAHLGPGRVRLLRTHHGYRARSAKIDGHLVAIRDAATEVPRYRGDAAFVYLRLAGDEFLFAPPTALRGQGAERFRNTFDLGTVAKW